MAGGIDGFAEANVDGVSPGNMVPGRRASRLSRMPTGTTGTPALMAASNAPRWKGRRPGAGSTDCGGRGALG